jgi:uncharacterized membrane protein
MAVTSAALFAVRDNIARWAERSNDVPGVVASVCSLAAATLVMVVVVAARGRFGTRVRAARRPFLVSGAIYGVASACVLAAFDRGRVIVVSPLVATESLWAVLASAFVLRRTEAIGVRLLTAAVLVVTGGALVGGFR